MKIPDHIRKTYTAFDPETAFFLDKFDEPSGLCVLEVGSHDAPIAKMLAECGFNVTGIDLRPCDFQATAPHKHQHFVGDFCEWASNWRPQFDCIVSVSAIEHFGLGTYGEPGTNPFYDVIAMRYVWDLLKEGGFAYVSVPIGGRFFVNEPHWRVYDLDSIKSRIVQGGKIYGFWTRVCESFQSNGVQVNVGENPDTMHILNNTSGFPGISALLKIRKIRKG